MSDLDKEKILTGEMPLGTRMSESLLATELGVSRTPIRTCLTRLVGEGIAKLVPNDGVYVEAPSRTDVLELWEIRIVLESYAASLAAQRAASEDLDQMKIACETQAKIIREMIESREHLGQKTVAHKFWMRVIRDVEFPFHSALVRASKNARLASMIINMQMLGKIFSRSCDFESHDIPGHGRSYQTHRRILRYVRQGAPVKASEAMRQHLQMGPDTTIRNFDKMQENFRMQESLANTWQVPRELG